MIEFAEVEFGNFDHTKYKGLLGIETTQSP
jgi:hypothetical protein